MHLRVTFDFFEQSDLARSVATALQHFNQPCCQDHIPKENIWFVLSKTSYSGYQG